MGSAAAAWHALAAMLATAGACGTACCRPATAHQLAVHQRIECAWVDGLSCCAHLGPHRLCAFGRRGAQRDHTACGWQAQLHLQCMLYGRQRCAGTCSIAARCAGLEPDLRKCCFMTLRKAMTSSALLHSKLRCWMSSVLRQQQSWGRQQRGGRGRRRQQWAGASPAAAGDSANHASRVRRDEDILEADALLAASCCHDDGGSGPAFVRWGGRG